MNYPKNLMSITELVRMGFPKGFLRKAVKSEWADHFTQRTGQTVRSKFLIDTEQFEKYRRLI